MLDSPLRNWLRVIIAFLLSGIVLIFLFHKYGTASTLSSLGEVKPLWLACAVAVAVLSNVIVSPQQWKWALRLAGCPMTFCESVFLKLSIYPIKGFLPFKSGEFLRAGYLKKHYDFSWAEAVGSVSLALIVNFYILLLTSAVCGFIALWGLGWGAEELSVLRSLMPFIAGSALVLSFLGAVFAFTERGRLTLSKLLSLLSASFKGRPHREEELAGLISSRLLPVILYGILALYLEFVVYYLLAKGMGIELPFVLVLAFIPLTMILTNLPSIFGLGVREGSLILFLSGYVSGADAGQRLLMSGVLFSLVDYILFALAGLFLVKKLVDSIV